MNQSLHMASYTLQCSVFVIRLNLANFKIVGIAQATFSATPPSEEATLKIKYTFRIAERTL
jgi:hypothetical protein